jgi:hypothetical protein
MKKPFTQPALAEEPAHTIITADAVEWKAAPASLPAGAQAVVLYGDPAKEGLFAMRLKLPRGYHIPPHTADHPRCCLAYRRIRNASVGRRNFCHARYDDEEMRDDEDRPQRPVEIQNAR